MNITDSYAVSTVELTEFPGPVAMNVTVGDMASVQVRLDYDTTGRIQSLSTLYAH